jgi:hypothetical protein
MLREPSRIEVRRKGAASAVAPVGLGGWWENAPCSCTTVFDGLNDPLHATEATRAAADRQAVQRPLVVVD